MSYDYLMVARQLVDGHFIAEPGPIRFIKVPSDVVQYDSTHVIEDRAAWVREVQGLADGDGNPNSISPTGDVLVFIHGYNNTIPNVLQRTRRLRADLHGQGWHGEVISFDWPSDDQTLNYLEDRADAAAVASELVTRGITLLVAAQKANCVTNVHLLGHSTGAYVAMEAFAQAQKHGSLFKSDWRVGQVAFISGDVSRSSLSNTSDWCQPMFSRIMRFTNYSNPFDSVLAISNAKRLGTAPRAGRVGLPDDVSEKAVNVDCGAYFRSLDPNDYKPLLGNWTHSWQIGNPVFALDLAMTLEGAIDRNAIPTRREENGRLVLQKGKRPLYQDVIDIKAQLNVAPGG
jgi:pimeloyl-ACP methyl ester carboxylesterase